MPVCVLVVSAPPPCSSSRRPPFENVARQNVRRDVGVRVGLIFGPHVGLVVRSLDRRRVDCTFEVRSKLWNHVRLSSFRFSILFPVWSIGP